jgi:hypothetical protein
MLLVVIVALIAFVLAVPVPVLSQLCLRVKIDKSELNKRDDGRALHDL